MRILVFDDSVMNQEAARAQLKDHDLTVVGTYDEAQKLLEPGVDYDLMDEILREQFGDFVPWNSNDEHKKAEYTKAKEEAEDEAFNRPNFDVVLTDLLVPASSQEQSTPEFIGKEMPVGIFIGLMAAVRARAKHVAVFTDSNHHAHPASACFDVFNYEHDENRPMAFMVDDSKVLLSNTRNWVETFDPADLSKALGYEEYKENVVSAKNWGKLLEYLLTA